MCHEYFDNYQQTIQKNIMNTVDTITAVCTGVGGAISIIRISGREALEIGNKVWNGSRELSLDDKRVMLLGKTVSFDEELGDPAMAVYMPGPNSYTGDDVVEIHGHGGSLSTKETLRLILNVGARLADPGEFTYRAFVNGKMDLTQAEAVSDIITAHSDMALHLAERQISGKLGTTVSDLRETLYNILSDIESRMDFADVDLDWTDNTEFKNQIEEVLGKAKRLWDSKNEGALLRDGVRVVIAGKPNVGKSSLLNHILGFDRAIVTDVAGTTRDTLEEFATIRHIPVKIIDTAGIREADDIIESMGIERSKQSIKTAQLVIWMIDASADDVEAELIEMKAHLSGNERIITIWNKIDQKSVDTLPTIDLPNVEVSVTNDQGIETFLDLFEETVWGFKHTEEPEFAVSERHAALLSDTLEALPHSVELLMSNDLELAAIHLRDAIHALGSITGEDVDPDVLDNIFSRFCLGK